jgi:hypothetical protein
VICELPEVATRQCRGDDLDASGLSDGLWQGPRVGPSGPHEPSPKGGRRTGLRAAEIGGADSSPMLTNMLWIGT